MKKLKSHIILAIGYVILFALSSFDLSSQELQEYYPPQHPQVSDSTFRKWSHALKETFLEEKKGSIIQVSGDNPRS